MDPKKIKETLFLPQTNFPLKNNNHQEIEKKIRIEWEEKKIYQKLLALNKDNPSFILHSGPTYANGRIHVGHVLNYILKDIIVRFYVSQGYYAPFLLGWDVHGLPIEHKVLQIHGEQKENLRYLCSQYAQEQTELQKEELKKLGLLTDYNKYYFTHSKEYQAEQIRTFGKLVQANLIHRSLRPIHWSCSHATALAENEIEYLPKEDYSFYFSLELVNPQPILAVSQAFLLIWTTQPWTIPANQLVAVKREASYSLIKWKNQHFLILTQKIAELSWLKEATIIKKDIIGIKLLGLEYYHPYQESLVSKVVDGKELVSETEGTGLLHCAPAFGAEDFALANQEKISVVCPLDEQGFFTSYIKMSQLIGKHYSKANDWIVDDLTKKGKTIHQEKITHSYPHDWRDKSPLIYRLTEQWFINLSLIKENLLSNIEDVQYYPTWAKEKMRQVMTTRSDWCISRQRKWGVPIPVLFNDDKTVLIPEVINFIADIFAENGSDGWFDGTILSQLRTKFPQWIKKNTKLSTDIFDVWFDSGVSHECVLNKEGHWPADLYLEGSDQFRGWFNSSLITATALSKKAPYHQILTHGFVVDAQGRKMSKSLGNVIDPDDLLKQYGADILRCWVASVDFTKETRISASILEGIKENYQKIRNTLRFLLGNLITLTNEQDLTTELDLVDQWILAKLRELIHLSKKNYSQYNFNTIYTNLLKFCSDDLSSFYLEISKDSLYCDNQTSQRRKQIITTLYYLLAGILKIITPLLPFLAEEVYQIIPFSFGYAQKASVMFLLDQFDSFSFNTENSLEKINNFLILRQEALSALEKARQKQIIHLNSQAELCIWQKANYQKDLSGLNLKKFLLVAQATLMAEEKPIPSKKEDYWEGEYFFIQAKKTSRGKCQRCWNYEPNNAFSQSENIFQDLYFCFRCSEILKN